MFTTSPNNSAREWRHMWLEPWLNCLQLVLRAFLPDPTRTFNRKLLPLFLYIEQPGRSSRRQAAARPYICVLELARAGHCSKILELSASKTSF
eukprot:1148710-Pelagomonas_calceolata.AAC.1